MTYLSLPMCFPHYKKKITFVIGRITFPQPLTDVHVPRTFECVTLHGGRGINFADGIKIANQLI